MQFIHKDMINRALRTVFCLRLILGSACVICNTVVTALQLSVLLPIVAVHQKYVCICVIY
ncbi:hypothetical protein T4A_8380 [Trichinella pseudospiralis]|uniref:Uncharacterized protein n=1 Tax=Trichinella pseudospiralis TaxID=6337 RepID=A0A0V1DMB0_TRIPS|nr:hypothetical protein T4A_8380 [Trichinella pseudospiralis]